MIVQITGILINKTIEEIIIDANGIGYLCNISSNTYNNLPDIGKVFTILTYLNISENKHSLYGFYSNQERNLFKMLIKVSGIGPKIGMQLLSNADAKKFEIMIINSDVTMLSTLPGIGPKTAKRLIIELKDKFTIVEKDDIPSDDMPNSHRDAHKALINLGYNSKSIEKIIIEITQSNIDISVENLIKECLKELR